MSPKKTLASMPIVAVLFIFFVFNMALVAFIYMLCKP